MLDATYAAAQSGSGVPTEDAQDIIYLLKMQDIMYLLHDSWKFVFSNIVI